MNKTYSGIELLKSMKNKEIPLHTKIYITFDWENYDEEQSMKFYTIYGEYRQLHLYREVDGKATDIRTIDTEDLLTKRFYIIEDKEDINIQDIEEIDINNGLMNIEIVNKFNELVQAVKQLDKTKEDK